MQTKGRIERAGKIHFGDASLSIWEEGLSNARGAGGWDAAQTWGLQFKREVFARIVQTLNRLGWTVGPWDQACQYKAIALSHRTCHKGDLRAELRLSGRHIELLMWQGVNTPTRPDNGGRYESDKEACMPYVLRLEMERTRRRIRDYLLNVFTEYSFEQKNRSIYSKPLQLTAMERIEQRYAESCHFKGKDFAGYVAKGGGMSYNLKSGDGQVLEQGQRVWLTDSKGRWLQGTAFYNINNMWWVALGRYDYTNKSCSELRVTRPDEPRIKQNARLRRRRLEALLADAVTKMDFERAALLRDITFGKSPQLFAVFHEEHGAYHCSGFCGYTKDLTRAGKFSAAEIKGYDRAPNKIIDLATA